MVAAVAHCVEHLSVCLWTKSVVNFGAVDCYFSDSVVELEQDVAVFFDGFPIASHILKI
jgi:hypothetical protein